MIFGVLISRKSYPLMKYLCVLLIVCGVAIFIYKDPPAQKVDEDHSQYKLFNSIGFGELLVVRCVIYIYLSVCKYTCPDTHTLDHLYLCPDTHTLDHLYICPDTHTCTSDHLYLCPDTHTLDHQNVSRYPHLRPPGYMSRYPYLR